jgi:hypothetical protein
LLCVVNANGETPVGGNATKMGLAREAIRETTKTACCNGNEADRQIRIAIKEAPQVTTDAIATLAR